MRRAVMSIVPPGTYGTMMRTGAEGHAWANAAENGVTAVIANKTANMKKRGRRHKRKVESISLTNCGLKKAVSEHAAAEIGFGSGKA